MNKKRRMHKTPFGQAKKEGEEKRGEFERNLFIKEGPPIEAKPIVGNGGFRTTFSISLMSFVGGGGRRRNLGNLGFAFFLLLL